METAAPLLTFECRRCDRRFEAPGKLEQWTSSIYGPCYEYQAPCPDCGTPTKEYRPRSSAKSEEDFDSGGGEGPGSEGSGVSDESPCGADLD
jgi:hypothetical protein